MARRITASLAVLAALTGCAQPELGAQTSGLTCARRDAVLGGDASADPQVFALIVRAKGGPRLCSATLIANRTLLTAAHCVDPKSEPSSVVATNVSSVRPEDTASIPPAQLYRAVSWWLHPAYDKTLAYKDVALVELDRWPGIAPKSWNADSVSELRGEPLRVLGYGLSDAKEPSSGGARRETALRFGLLSANHYLLGEPDEKKGICSGDSGGPSLYQFPDGSERVVGVHSFLFAAQALVETCTLGADTRVDAVSDFIRAWLNEKERPSCEDDGYCVEGCDTPDVDCGGCQGGAT